MKIVNVQKRKQFMRARRHRRVRARISGSSARPRLSVFRSAKHLFAQLIDDTSGHTLVSASDKEVAVRAHSKVGTAEAVGKLLGRRAVQQGITAAVFDRGGYAYHGRVKAAADGARAAGLQF